MVKYIAFILLWPLCYSANAQKKDVKGSGYILTQERKTPYFNSIEVSDHISVYIVQGKFMPLTVEADNNLFSYIKTEVQDEVLKIFIPDSINIVRFTFMSILISLPEIRELTAQQHSLINAAPQKWEADNVTLFATSGSKIHLAVHASSLRISAKTAAIIELKGAVQQLNATLSSTSKLYAKNFEVQTGCISLNNYSKAEINVLQNLQYDLKGKSRLLYKGNPKSIVGHTDASSKIKHSK